MNARKRIVQHPGFVLHSYPWRETSLIVDVFAKEHGRFSLVAKGARRPGSALRLALMSFRPLLLDWSGNGEVKNLVRAEWQGGAALLQGKALICGYYLNELLLKLLVRDDPLPHLFTLYGETLKALSTATAFSPLLRRFELTLLQELGYQLPLTQEADTGLAIDAQAYYHFQTETGAIRVSSSDAGGEVMPVFRGQTLIDMAAGIFQRPETQRESRHLLRRTLDHYLHGQALQSRKIFEELQQL